jgi:RNA polymerase sigma factor (sigma-70 family)
MASGNDDALLAKLTASREAFLAIIDDIRPDLHRYCARMTGSTIDGEDIVQDVLARAYYEISCLDQVPALRPWLFRIAHNRAIDHLRRYDHRYTQELEAEPEIAADADTPEAALARQQTVTSALNLFLELPPTQRSCVILKDILGHSSEEVAQLLELSLPAVNAALHRGRTRLRTLASIPESAPTRAATSPDLARYAALFNSRDWDAVRATLADDVRLDLVAKLKRAGRRNVSQYFSNYDSLRGWQLVPGFLDGRELLGVFLDDGARPAYFIEVELVEGRVSAIRDFRYAPYLTREARFERTTE